MDINRIFYNILRGMKEMEKQENREINNKKQDIFFGKVKKRKGKTKPNWRRK